MITKNLDHSGIPLAACSAMTALVMLIAMAAAVPVLPHEFYGSATINGRDVPSGSVISAEIDGSGKGSVVVFVEGAYGSPGITDPTETKLMVQDGQPGDTIVFYVQTPGMANRLPAAETAAYGVGEKQELGLTFSGEEVPKQTDSDPSSSSSSSSSGGGGGSSSGTTETEPEEPEPLELPSMGSLKVLEITGESHDIELGKKDTLNLIFAGSEYPIYMKSMSDFSVLLELEGENIVLGVGESKDLDLNGDLVTDIRMSLTSIEKGKALLTFTELEKDSLEAGLESVTGHVAANPIVPGAITLIIIAALGGSVYRLRRRGSI
jgi:hypothetical protein